MQVEFISYDEVRKVMFFAMLHFARWLRENSTVTGLTKLGREIRTGYYQRGFYAGVEYMAKRQNQYIA